MKKTLAGLGILLSILAYQKAEATILILRDASNLSRGLLPCARLDPNCGLFSDATQATTTLRTDVDGKITSGENNAGVLRSSHTNAGALGGLIGNGVGVISSTMTKGLLENAPGVLRSSHTNAGASGGLVANGVGVIASTQTAGLFVAGEGNAGVLRSSHSNVGATGGLVGNGAGVIFSSMTTGLIPNTVGVLTSSHTNAGAVGGLVENGASVISSSQTFGLITAGQSNAGVIYTSMTIGFIPNTAGVLRSSHTKSGAIGGLVENGVGGIFSTHIGASGVIATNYTNTNLTVNSAGIITAASNGTGGGTPVYSSLSEIVIGTVSATGVNATIANLADWNTALASTPASGLTTSTTGQAVFYFKNGIYSMMGATVPAGVTIVCASSVVFQAQNANQTIMTNYGIVGSKAGFPCIVDGAGRALDAQVFAAKINSESNLILVGGEKQAGDTGRSGETHFFSAIDSSGTRGDLWFKGFKAQGSNTTANPSANTTMAIVGGENHYFRIRTSSWLPSADAGNLGRQFLSIKRSTATYVEFDSEAAGSSWITLEENPVKAIIKGKFHARSEASGYEGIPGMIRFNYQNAGGHVYATTGTFISIEVVAHGAGNYRIVNTASGGATSKNSNPTIYNSVINCVDWPNTYSGALINTDTLNAVVDSVYINGCNTGISDSGTASKFRYFFNGTLVAN